MKIMMIKNEFVREQQTSSFHREKIYGYEEPEPFETYKHKIDSSYLNIKFSDRHAEYSDTVDIETLDIYPNILNYNVELKDSLYYHISDFIIRMNDKTIFEELHQIKGPLNKDKKNKIKNLFKKKRLNPNNKKKKKNIFKKQIYNKSELSKVKSLILLNNDNELQDLLFVKLLLLNKEITNTKKQIDEYEDAIDY